FKTNFIFFSFFSHFKTTDSSSGMKNEYNTIRSLKKGSIDSRTYACAQENTYQEPHGNHNHVYSGSSGGSSFSGPGTNSTSAGFVGASSQYGGGGGGSAGGVGAGGTTTQLVGTFGRLG